MFIKELGIPNMWDGTVANYLTGDNTYFIVNASPDIIYAVESDDLPEETVIGNPVRPFCAIKYKKGAQRLFLRNGYTSVQTSGTDAEIKYSKVIINKVDG